MSSRIASRKHVESLIERSVNHRHYKFVVQVLFGHKKGMQRKVISINELGQARQKLFHDNFIMSMFD
jgi:hypothetical protein